MLNRPQHAVTLESSLAPVRPFSLIATELSSALNSTFSLPYATFQVVLDMGGFETRHSVLLASAGK